MTTNCQCGSHPPAKPQAVELEKLEAILADCRARKAKAAPGTPMPFISCLATATATADLRKGSTRQASAELDRLRAENMTLKTKIAATIKPAPAKPAAPAVVPGLSPRDQRRAAAQGTIADQSDAQLQFIAGHRSATAEDAAAAKNELTRRGWQIHANGAFSLSTVKKSRR